ncbi:FAD-binding oxidoreductase [Bacterioplanoides sp.]|uniref:FAD-binding oxidoreductase n=1 Tax=Bacterioplanoides sp. TaxID=2066072 RepID=UPI003B000D7E
MIDVSGSALPTQSVTEVNTNTWTNGRHMVRCARVIDETHDVKTFCFLTEQPVLFFFKPGQFVTLELEINGQPVMRSYTISSSPSTPYSFSLTIKRVGGGLVSNWLHDNLNEGDLLPVHGPVGNFNCIDFPAKKVLLLSGGVGITPVMSMARWYYDTSSDVDMVFIHSARTPMDVVYHGELTNMCSRVPNFHLHLISEREARGVPWSGYRGYFDQAKLDMMVPDLHEREVFCCGPEPYMDAVKALLKANNFNMEHYHEESFGSTPDSVEQDAIDQAEEAEETLDAVNSADMLTVEFTEAGKSIQILPGETVHTAAANLGMHIPKACGMGICGTCKVKKTAGEVEMNHNGGITDEDVADGYILSCCSVPTGHVVIEK